MKTALIQHCRSGSYMKKEKEILDFHFSFLFFWNSYLTTGNMKSYIRVNLNIAKASQAACHQNIALGERCTAQKNNAAFLFTDMCFAPCLLVLSKTNN